MRWRFADPNNASEAAAKSEVLASIHEWWDSFAAKADDLDAHFSRGLDMDVPKWVNAHLIPIDRRFSWEFGRAVRGGGHRLVITPESYHELRPMLDTMMALAPRLPRWEFYPYRLPEPPAHAQAMVNARVGIDCPDATVRVARGSGNRIDLTYRSSSFRAKDPHSGHAALVLTESLVGEEMMDKWVGGIEPEPAPARGLLGGLLGRGRSRDRFVPLDRLKPTFHALIESSRDQFDDRPLHQFDLVDSAEWTLYELKPPDQPTYPRWDDLFIGGSARMGITRSIGPLFQSCRFSRFGETFCYLKIDHGDTPKDQWVSFRACLEEAIDPALRAAKLGCIYGDGTGTIYSYVELALTDMNDAIDLLRQALRPLDAPTNTWLLFHDTELRDEWVGLYDETPPPPVSATAGDEE